MAKLRISVSFFEFVAYLEEEKAPQTCKAFCTLLPMRSTVIQALWSGEATWIPLPQSSFFVNDENSTTHPSNGELLLYPGDRIEHGLLFPYQETDFKSKDGALAGNHFLTIVSGHEYLQKLGHLVLWKGSQEILLEMLPSS